MSRKIVQRLMRESRPADSAYPELTQPGLPVGGKTDLACLDHEQNGIDGAGRG